MTTVSKITVGTIEAGYKVTFVEGDFPTYGMGYMSWDNDESIVEDVLADPDHTRFGKSGREAHHLANLTDARVIYQA